MKGLSTVSAPNHLLRKYSDIAKYAISPKKIKYLAASATGSAHDGYNKYGTTHDIKKNNLYLLTKFLINIYWNIGFHDVKVY